MGSSRYLFLLVLLGVLAACMPGWTADDILTKLNNDGRFLTLMKNLQAAGIADTLKGTGPYTVFAPTDDAFAKYPADQMQQLVNDKPRLGSFLLSHIAPGNPSAAQLARLQFLATLQGGHLTINARKNNVMVDNARVIQAEIQASNGVIYVIDTVLQPRRTIIDALAQDGHFTQLLKALQAANLTNTISNSSPITLFAPTDEALAKLPAGTLDKLLQDIPRLTQQLEYHIVTGKVQQSELRKVHTMQTILGEPLTIKTTDNITHVNEAQITRSIPAANGLILVLDTEITLPVAVPAP